MSDSKVVAPSGRPKPPNAGKGRPKGSKNKTTKLALDAIAAAAEELGGVDRLVAWAREDEKNEHTFWGTIYPKLLPLQVNADVAGEVVAKVVFKGLNDR